MSYYLSERNGKGYLRSGFKSLERHPDTTDDSMKPCFEFDSFELCREFGVLLFQGLEKIYDKYLKFIPRAGNKVFWISTYSQSHLRELVGPKPVYCKNPDNYKYYYTFSNETERNKALKEMQTFANNLYKELTGKNE